MGRQVDGSTGRRVNCKGVLFNDSHFCLFVDVYLGSVDGKTDRQGDGSLGKDGLTGRRVDRSTGRQVDGSSDRQGDGSLSKEG